MFNIFKTNEDKFKNYEFARYGINLVDFENYRKNNFITSHNFKNADYILFTQRYEKNDLKYIQQLIDLTKIHKKKLIIFLKRPEFKNNDKKKNNTVLDDFFFENDKKINKNLMDKFLFQQLNYYEDIKELNNQIKKVYYNKVLFYDLYSVFCDPNQKKCHSINEKENKIFYDHGHLTLEGSRFIGNILFEEKFHINFLE